MAEWAQMGLPWIALACFGLAAASAVFPWMSAEIVVLALPALAPSPKALAALLLIATAGQMAGKCIVYWTGRGTFRWASPRITRAVERWRGRLGSTPSRAMGLVFLSSAAGRLLRFGALVYVPQIIVAWTSP